jgi:hypothetical protein
VDKKDQNNLCEIAQIEESLKQEFDQTLREKLLRYLKVKPHTIIPNMKFATASAEFSLLFRDGHFYGCIALVQAVAEALVRFLCQRNKMRVGKFDRNIDRLFEKKVITFNLKESFLEIWEKRNDYHHLNSTIETDRQELEKIAEEKAKLIVEIEKEIFAFSLSADGKIIPRESKYWEGSDDKVFLRLDP